MWGLKIPPAWRVARRLSGCRVQRSERTPTSWKDRQRRVEGPRGWVRMLGRFSRRSVNSSYLALLGARRSGWAGRGPPLGSRDADGTPGGLVTRLGATGEEQRAVYRGGHCVGSAGWTNECGEVLCLVRSWLPQAWPRWRPTADFHSVPTRCHDQLGLAVAIQRVDIS